MAKHGSTASGAKTPAARSDQNASGGSAGIEIVGFPQKLYTRTFGDPDTLFVPLLEAARDANKMLARLIGLGEERGNAVTLSGTQLASSLLRDNSFSLVSIGLSHENTYTVDLNSETLHMRTRLYAVMSGRTSFFKVEIAGKISGGTFVVRNPIHGTVIMQVEEERFRQASFFSTTLAQECLRAQVEQERFGIMEELAGADIYNEMRLMVMVEGSKVPIALRQKEEAGGWDIIDGKRNEAVGKLSPEIEENLKKVINFVQDLSVKK
jgi:hypothetical protein